jgi:tetratricopeptide (TPR) repeat protein
VQLFLSGLARVRQGYQPEPGDLGHILEVCQRVEGMPLGILLASSWGSSMSPGEIASESQRGLDFLSAEWGDLPARQRSVRATFEYSWNLLNAQEQSLFQGLSVYRGGFSRRAARQVLGATPFELRAQVDKSLLLSSSPGRYEMHELLRQFGRGMLAESPQVEYSTCQKHGSYFLGRLSRLGELVKSAQQEAALVEIDLDHENYHAAWHWMVRDGDAHDLIEPLEALCLYYDLRWRSQEGEAACRAGMEGLSRFKDSLEITRTRIRMLAWQSHFQHLLGELEAADRLLDEAQVLIDRLVADGKDTRQEQAVVLFERGDLNFNSDRNVAAEYYGKSLEIYREVGDTWNVARTLANLGMVNHHMGTFQQAAKHWQECLEIHRRIEDSRGIADALVELGMNLVRSGQYEEGEGYMKEGTAILQGIGDKASLARGYYELCRPQYWIHGDFAKSYEYLDKSCQIYHELGFRDRWVFSRFALNLFLLQQGKYKEAFERTRDDLALAEDYNLKREIGFAYYNWGIIGLVKGDFEQAYRWALKSAECYQEAGVTEFWCNSLAVLIFISHAMRQTEQAAGFLRQALKNALPIKAFYTTMHITLAGALLLADRGELEKALELAALANRYPFVGNSSWCKDVAGPVIKATREALPQDTVEAAEKRGLERDIWEAAEGLLEIFEGDSTNTG